MTTSQKQFIAWLKKNDPKLYRAAIARMNSTLSGDEPVSWFDKLTSSITDLAPKYLQYKQQKKVMKMQMNRAQQGLPPANVADYSPVIKTNVQLAPETRADLIKAGKESISDNMKPILIGGILVAFFMLSKKRR